MSTPVEEAQRIAGLLKSRGINAAADPRRVSPPCVLITPPAVRFDTGCGGTAEWTALVIASAAADHRQAWEQCDALVAKVLAVIDIERAEPASWSSGDDADPQTAYRLSWSAAVEWNQ